MAKPPGANRPPSIRLPWIRWLQAALAVGAIWLLAYFLSRLALLWFPELTAHTNTLGQLSAAILLWPVLATEFRKLELARARERWSGAGLVPEDKEELDQALNRAEAELAQHRGSHLALYLLGLFGVMFTLAIGL
jgi:hypothetical protein